MSDVLTKNKPRHLVLAGIFKLLLLPPRTARCKQENREQDNKTTQCCT